MWFNKLQSFVENNFFNNTANAVVFQSTVYSTNYIWRNMSWSNEANKTDNSVLLCFYVLKEYLIVLKQLHYFGRCIRKKNPLSFHINFIRPLFSFTYLLKIHGIWTILKCFRTSLWTLSNTLTSLWLYWISLQNKFKVATIKKFLKQAWQYKELMDFRNPNKLKSQMTLLSYTH